MKSHRMKMVLISGVILAAAWMVTGREKASAAYLTSNYADNFALPETQSGYAEEKYEGKAAQKLQRGLENFFMAPLEISHGVKVEAAYRKAEYLPVGLESFFIGAGRGVGNTFKRMAVGFYEVVTFAHVQEPILEEMSDWAY